MTSKLLTGCAAFAVTLSAATSWAGPQESILYWSSAAAVGQNATAQQVESLLLQARQLMQAGDYQAAEDYISKAEKLSSTPFGLFHRGDTPKKAREDLERMRSGQAGPVRRTAHFPPFSFGNEKEPAQDPFLRGGATPNSSTAAGTPSGAAAPGSRPAWAQEPAPARTVTAGGNVAPPDRKAQSDRLIVDARRALSRGDMRSAMAAVEQCKSLQVTYGPLDDSPVKVDLTIRKAAELAQAGGARDSDAYRRQYCDLLMEQAQGLLLWNQLEDAERLAKDAKNLGVNYTAFEAKPDALLNRIAAQKQPAGNAAPGSAGPAAPAPWAQTGGSTANIVERSWPSADARISFPVTTASGTTPPAGERQPGVNALYNPANDPTRNIRVNAAEAPPLEPVGQYFGEPNENIDNMQRVPAPATAASEPSVGQRLYQQGEQALRDGQTDTALNYFRQAHSHQQELDPTTRQRLQDHLQMLSTVAAPAAPRANDGAMMENVAVQQQVLARQVSAEVARQQSTARAMMEKEPKRAFEALEKTRGMLLATAELEPAVKENLVRRIDFSISEVRGYIQKNQPQIQLDDQNKAVRAEIERDVQVKVEVQEKLALLVDDFNKLMDEQRFAEAEVLAKKAAEIDPENPLVIQLMQQSRTTRRWMEQMEVRGLKEDAIYKDELALEAASVPFEGPIQYPDAKVWKQLSEKRGKLEADGRYGRTPRDIEIERKLSTQVSLKFQNRPLSEVMNYLARLAQVNLHLDPQGLAEEGISTETPVTIDLTQEISMKSALKLILEPLDLSYVIKDEVLKITSQQLRHGDVYTVSYSVADLIVPIPNFVPGGNLGMEGALQNAHNRLGAAANPGFGGQGPLAVVASDNGANTNAVINPALLAQMNAAGAGPVSGSAQPLGFGPGGLGGGVQADFDSLIDLITSTIQPQTWDAVGGPGSIAPFETNLSLVVSQTQEVHEEIVDLLQQLRRLQDLQVTIEVRFITLNDNFFERIGVDFDFDIDNDEVDFAGDDLDPLTDDRSNLQRGIAASSAVTGLSPGGSVLRDLQFRQGSFTASVPTFGGFDPATAGTFGFAILSDIEAFFLIEAAQGDNRTNVLQAPKVTLFNGQQAFVSDTSQRPFVTSVIPVVGDFAAAQQPVIVVLSEGTSLTVQAVVSSDRRFVRLTVVPFFSQIGEVEEFTFTGSRTTTRGSSSTTDDDDNSESAADDASETIEGTTVQLPTFSFITVTTTVSVPDGGTVLLGGIKRLSEQRNERGLPILSKLPYINRLFRNVGIGRETRSLMMMVTPRIIIQEEEEANLGILVE